MFPTGSNFFILACFAMVASQKVVIENEAVEDEPVQVLARQSGLSVEHLERVREVLYAQAESAVVNDAASTLQDGIKEIIRNNDDYKSGQPSIIDLNAKLRPYLFHGDILLSEEQLDILEKELETGGKSSRSKRFAPMTWAHLWDTTKPIPYRFYENLAESGQEVVKAALEILSSRSCLSFELKPSSSYGLNFFSGDGCYSKIGQSRGWQPVSLPIGCHTNGIATHEILHALGSDHEQNRYDRTEYASVDLSLVSINDTHNFILRTQDDNDNLGVPYDFGSIMHYGAYDFSMVPERPVIVPNDRLYMQTMGQRRFVSFNDLKALNKLYKCNDQCSSLIHCMNGGYVHPKDCSKCVCADFFTGTFCEAPVKTTSVTVGSSHAYFYSGSPAEGVYQPYGDWELFEKTPAQIFEAPIGKRLNVTITHLSGSWTCVSSCNHVGVEVVEGDDLTRGGKTFCCRTDSGKSFTTNGNKIGVKGWNFPGGNLKFGLEIQAV